MPPILNPQSQLDNQAAIEARFANALPFYRSRGGVLFVSYCRFWERHAFVQQSLARTLVEADVAVTWLDGTGRGNYRPTLYWDSPKLSVRELFELPLRRFAIVQKLSIEMQARSIRDLVGNGQGGRPQPLVWVQAGVEEALAHRMPYIDVFSTFDDPYKHKIHGSLCTRAKLILAQNSFAQELLENSPKVHVALPPVELPAKSTTETEIALPVDFPKKVMGFVGSLFAKDFDFVLFETFVRALPEWGFLLMGRTCPEGEYRIQVLREYKNFCYLPWVPREQAAAAWKKLDVTLLLCRPNRYQDGAFPTKILESLHYGVPVVATRTKKTDDLEGFIPRHSFPEELIRLAVESAQTSSSELAQTLAHFTDAMNPKLHLARVAEWLSR